MRLIPSDAAYAVAIRLIAVLLVTTVRDHTASTARGTITIVPQERPIYSDPIDADPVPQRGVSFDKHICDRQPNLMRPRLSQRNSDKSGLVRHGRTPNRKGRMFHPIRKHPLRTLRQRPDNLH